MDCPHNDGHASFFTEVPFFLTPHCRMLPAVSIGSISLLYVVCLATPYTLHSAPTSQKFWGNLYCFWDHFWAKRYFSEARPQIFTWMSLPFLPIVLCTGLVLALLVVQATPPVCKTNHLLYGKLLGQRQERDPLALFTAISQVSTWHLLMRAMCKWALHRYLPSIGTNGNDMQATIEGKTGPDWLLWPWHVCLKSKCMHKWLKPLGPGNEAILSIFNNVLHAQMTIQCWTNTTFESTGHLTSIYDNQPSIAGLG